MIAVKIVLSNEDREVELGPFNQGVVYNTNDPTAPLSMYDVASSEAVLRFLPHVGWIIEGDESHRRFENCFVQAFDPQPSNLLPIPREARWA